ncbi:unnamed protein product, partial [Nesidiocoris tenuis]
APRPAAAAKSCTTAAPARPRVTRGRPAVSSGSCAFRSGGSQALTIDVALSCTVSPSSSSPARQGTNPWRIRPPPPGSLGDISAALPPSSIRFFRSCTLPPVHVSRPPRADHQAFSASSVFISDR